MTMRMSSTVGNQGDQAILPQALTNDGRACPPMCPGNDLWLPWAATRSAGAAARQHVDGPTAGDADVDTVGGEH